MALKPINLSTLAYQAWQGQLPRLLDRMKDAGQVKGSIQSAEEAEALIRKLTCTEVIEALLGPSHLAPAQDGIDAICGLAKTAKLKLVSGTSFNCIHLGGYNGAFLAFSDEKEGAAITHPFFDSTGTEMVDPVSVYGVSYDDATLMLATNQILAVRQG